MGAEHGIGREIVDEVVGRVLDHRDLLEHDLALRVDVDELRPEDHVGHHVERVLEPCVGHARVDDRRLARRRGVELAAELVEELGDLLRRVARRALEEHVLDEVRDAGLRLGLVAGAGSDPEAERDRAHAGHALADDAFAAGELGQLVLRHARIVGAAGAAPTPSSRTYWRSRSRGRPRSRPRHGVAARPLLALLTRRGVLRPLDELLGHDEPAVLVLRDELEPDASAVLVDLLDDDVDDVAAVHDVLDVSDAARADVRDVEQAVRALS